MKQSRLLGIVLVVIGLFVLSGCKKQAMDPEKAGEILVQQLIHNKQEKEFKEVFADSEVLLEKMTEEKEALSEAAVNVAEGLPRKEIKKYVEQLDRKMQQVTSYKVDAKKISKEKVTITYTVHGLDYAAVLKNTLDELSKQIIANESLADDEKALNKVTGFLFNHALTNGKAKTNTVKVKLEITNVKGKWKVSSKSVMNVYLAFLTGNKSVDDFKVEMSRTIQETMMQQNEQMNE